MTLHNFRRIASVIRVAILALGSMTLLASGAAGQDVHLIAAPLTKSVTLPNGTSAAVPMWGFALDSNGNGTLDAGEAPTVPGPRITVAPGASTLTIQLVNTLSQPVSIMIPGLAAPGNPVRDGGGRIVSFAPEASPGGGTATYTWGGVKPGTYLYQSGSHPAVQVQMGLYGAVTQDAAADVAYTGISYAHESLLLFSEIDVALHRAVADGTYGNAVAGGPTSTIDYSPSLFLVNGESYVASATPLAAGVSGERTLVRMLNAGLVTHVAVVDNASMSIVAEDGSPYADARTQATVLLPAGKTHDAIWVPAAAGQYTVYDRALRLEALNQPLGGMLAKLDVAQGAGGGGSGGTVTGVPDIYSSTEDLPFSVGGLGVLSNDTGAGTAQIYSAPMAGTVSLDPTGGFTYIPRLNFSGIDSFFYVALNGSDASAPTQVVISVLPMQDPPIAYPLSLGIDEGAAKPVTVTAVDPDGDPVSFYISQLPTKGTLTLSGVSRAAIASIDAATDTVATNAPHGLTTGQNIILTDTTAQPALNGTRMAVTVVDPTHFTIPTDVTAGQGAGGYLEAVAQRTLGAGDLFVSAASPGAVIPGGTLVYRSAACTPAAPCTDSFRFVAGDGMGIGAGNVSSPAVVDIGVHPVPSAVPTGDPITLTVLGVDTRNPTAAPVAVTDYKWTLEEDPTYLVTPGALDPNTLAVSFHRSYAPVVQSGDGNTPPRVDPAKRYFVSVLPKSGGFSNGGAPIALNQTAVTVMVDKGPLPTAQILVRVFQDNSPLNNQWDTNENPLVGFEVSLDDAGGRYGMAGGQMMQDSFGNPLGTTYAACANPSGCDSYEVATLGQGFVLSDADGFARFKYLRPGKYTVKVIPPAGQNWQQTTTIEGQKGQDAWVKANEPNYFTEFGPAGPHVEIGFVQPTNTLTTGGGGKTITGTITNLHQSRPPDFTMFSGAPFDFTRAWVALNVGVDGELLYAQPTNADGTFSIEGVPPGTYTLAIWDSALDTIFAAKSVVVGASDPATKALGDIPVFSWFTRLYHYVFEDTDKNGQRSAGEVGIREVPINTRWRDGTVYQSSATDGSGFLPFEETFPFFAWQIAEVDYGRFRATGVTTVVDNGGNPLTDTAWAGAVGADADYRVLAPQPQTRFSEWGANESAILGGIARKETGPALLEGFQGFVGLTNVFLWGKAPYDMAGSHSTDINVAPFDDFPGTGDTDWNGNGKFDVDEFNGGITGIVHYSTTRAENNARWGTPEPWEPGIARATVQLWDASRTHLLNEVQTDSWDDSVPTGCQGAVFSYLNQATDCYDGMRNWNQIRPAVFDGGYAFYTILQGPTAGQEYNLPLDQRTVQKPLPAGSYVVKVIPPTGYQLVKEEDKNVDFGDEYVPAEFYLAGYPLADAGGNTAPPKEKGFEDPIWAPFCVGDLHTVPEQLALFPGVLAAYAGDEMPLCNEKLVTVRNGNNAAANFFLFTEAPIAGHIIGFVLDDASNEFDPNSPQFGEKYAPPWLPVSIRDWTGREISRTYTDRYGVYNALVPSTYTASTAIPSGMTPSMLTACINSPTKADGSADAFYNKQYSQFCYTLNYMPGTTTYLDTPVVPTGAFAGPGQATLDAELPDKTPVIYSVTQGASATGGIGPYIVDIPANAAARTITIKSEGPTQVTNPAFDANLPNGSGNPKNITRDYGFGSVKGQLYVGATLILSANISSWNDSTITAVIPTGTETGQVKVVRCLDAGCTPTQKRDSALGVTLTIAGPLAAAVAPPKTVSAGGKIQAAIDAASAGDLVLVAPGTYDELVVMDKPIRLQGWGAPSTIINAVKTPAEKIQAWRNRVHATLTANSSYLLPFQATQLAAGFDPTGELLGPMLGGEGAAVTVLARNVPIFGVTCPQVVRLGLTEAFGLQLGGRPNARIDGFGITGSDQAAGIEVNAFACNLEIQNNRIYSNTGDFGGGIKIGHPGAVPDLADGAAHNDYVTVAYNHVLQNSSLDYDSGGGIAIGTGAGFYKVTNNFVAGNFTFGRGAGIAHIGQSDQGTIDHNTIVFNEVFNQDSAQGGGGIYVGGRLPAAAELTPGSGSVILSNNLIQGNAAIGDGAGIALAYVNGSEGAARRYRIDLFGNTIVNNVAGLAGGGIALQDAVSVQIFHNTVARNYSLAVAGAAFPAGPNQSQPLPAGIVSRANSPQLNTALGVASGYSNPAVWNSVVWQNRSYSFGQITCPDPLNPACGTVNLDNQGPQYGLIQSAAGPGHSMAPYWDFGVLGATGGINTSYSVVTTLDGVTGTNNSITAPAFVRAYDNGDRKQSIVAPDIASAIPVPAVFDEGGNFIRPMFGPLTLNRLDTGLPYGDYHLGTAVNGQPLFGGQIGGVAGRYATVDAVPVRLRVDADVPADSRIMTGVYPTRGADQISPPPPPTLSINDVSITEPNSGTTTMTFNVTLSSASATPVTVNYATADGPLVGGAFGGASSCSATGVLNLLRCDYVTKSGSLNFAAGVTSMAVTVVIKGDTRAELNEVFYVDLSAPVGATIAKSRGTGTIVNND